MLYREKSGNPAFQLPAEATPSASKYNDVPQSRESRREQLILFVKLFVIMGLSWFSEVVHVFLHGDHSQNEHCNYLLEVCAL
jgi:hypothetical protein